MGRRVGVVHFEHLAVGVDRRGVVTLFPECLRDVQERPEVAGAALPRAAMRRRYYHDPPGASPCRRPGPRIAGPAPARER